MALMVLGGGFGESARAQTETNTVDVYEIQDVAVDVTAETAAAARTQALAEGEKRAFRMLLERLTLTADAGQLPKLKAKEISTYVKDFQVANEKTSPVRYLASLTYHFKSQDVRDLLKDWGVPFAETPSKPVLVLPVYQAAGALLLWDDPNPWRDAWGARQDSSGLVPMLLPLGDLQDIRAIGAEQAIDGDQQRLVAIAKKYNAWDTLVAVGKLGLSPTGRPELEVFVTRYGSALVEQTVVQSYIAAPGEGVDALLRRAAENVAKQVEDNWKRDNLLQFGQQAVASVAVPIRTLQDWLKVRSRLGHVAVIRRIDLVVLSRDEARVNLHYIGDPDQLALALEQSDLVLSYEGDDWVLSPADKNRGG